MRIKGMIIAMALVGIVWSITGCVRHERRTVTVTEEQREGDVEDVSPGEMIVE